MGGAHWVSVRAQGEVQIISYNVSEMGGMLKETGRINISQGRIVKSDIYDSSNLRLVFALPIIFRELNIP
jgi:hypothetical protein